MTWLWRPFFDHLGKKVEILTGAFYEFYGPPGGFGYDENNNDDPIVNDLTLSTYNAPEMA